MAMNGTNFANDSLPLSARLMTIDRNDEDFFILATFQLADRSGTIALEHTIRMVGNDLSDEDNLRLARHFLAIDLSRAAEATRDWLLDEESKKALKDASDF